ncbi:Hly-III related protein, partial [Wilcoxina mikolae CBS 423.85]
VNIYSHICGVILFVALAYCVISPRYSVASLEDLLVLSMFFFGAIICFLLSTIYLIFNNHSSTVAAFGNQLAYLAIVVLISRSTIPTIYYSFYCNPNLQITVVLGATCAISTLHTSFRRPALRKVRTVVYICLGLSAIVPVVHGVRLYGWETQKHRMSLKWVVLTAILNLLGSATYAAQIPEKWYPLRHDIFGASHQILHFMAIFAGLAHMCGLLRAFDYTHSQNFMC